MKKAAVALAILFLFSTAKAQPDTTEIKAAIYKCADSMSNAFKTRNWQQLAHFTLPSVVVMLGGEEGYAELTGQAMKEIPDTSVKAFSIGPLLQLVKADTAWQCIIEQHLWLSINGMSIRSMSPLIGQSNSTGLQWTFFDSKGDVASARKILPTLSPKLKLPKSNREFLNPPPLERIKKPTAGAKKGAVVKKKAVRKS